MNSGTETTKAQEMIKEHDVISYNGKMVTVVYIYAEGKAIEVEYKNDNGQTVLETLTAEKLENNK